MSAAAYDTDTRFGSAESHRARFESLTGKKILHTIRDAEPVGPQKLLDLLLIAPCTGNTLAKIANGITDTSVTMAAKAHIRNQRPLVIFISTNDALGINAKNLGTLLAAKYIYFVPFGQDDPVKKPTSLISDPALILPVVEAALSGEQPQPLLKI
jgi:dipicolinate synthase subunit B